MTNMWWKASEHDVVHRAWDRYRDLRAADEVRCQSNLVLLRHYCNRDLVNYDRVLPLLDHRSNRSLNLSKSVVDTIATKVGKMKPKPTFVTSGGDYTLRRRAQNLDRYVEGQYLRMGVYQKKERLLKDAEIYGTGIWHLFREDGRINLESVFPNELIVDHHEAMYRKPLEMFRHKRVSREALKARFPDMALAIDEVNAASGPDFSSIHPEAAEDTDMVTTVGAWRLPTDEKKSNGRFVWSLDKLKLVDIPYTRERFPYLFMHWDEPTVGFWGSGIIEQTAPIDLHVNRMLDRIELSLKKLSLPMVFMDQNSLVGQGDKMTNEVANIYFMKQGAKDPRVVVPSSVSPDLFNHMERRISQAFEISGVSQLSAQSQKPSGLDAAVALREFNDIESERFIMPSQRFEHLIAIDLADHVIDLTKEIAEDPDSPKEALTVKSVNGMTAVDIKWEDVDLDRDSYVLQVFPTSSLPSTPAARQARVQELMESGMITLEEGRQLADMPDLQAFNDRKLAPQKLIEKIIEEILEGGQFIGPEPYFPLEAALPRFQEAYMQGLTESVSGEKLQKLQDWMLAAEKLIQRSQPPVSVEQPLPEEQLPEEIPQEIPGGLEAPPQAPEGIV